MQLTPHFTLAELCQSDLAARRGIENSPAMAQINALKLLALQILEPVRSAFAIPFSPSSGYRSLALNRSLGSSDRSQHVNGEAVDLKLPGIDTASLARWIANTLVFDQLILECYDPANPKSGWVHCSFSENKARGQVLTYSKRRYFKGLIVND